MDKNQQIEILKKIAEETLKVQKDKQIKPGDIVEDYKNCELGIYLGTKPKKDPESFVKRQVIKHTEEQGEIVYYVLLTLSKDPAGHLITRIRYTNQKYVAKIMNPPEQLYDRLSDIKDHCENQCFIECSEECSLYRWKMVL
jgi:hypothetical protein